MFIILFFIVIIMVWNHYPNSPFGDIDICEHGCDREHGDTHPVCIYCDYPEDSKFSMFHCKNCNPNTKVLNWFLNNKCIKCGKEYEI
jgi:hypothetical protein